VTGPAGFALADLLLGLGAAHEMERGGSVQKCPSAASARRTSRRRGASLRDVLQTFAMACVALKGMHKGTAHVGKVPARQAKSIERESQMKNLQRDLRKAVSGGRLRIRGDDPRCASGISIRNKAHGEPISKLSLSANGCRRRPHNQIVVSTACGSRATSRFLLPGLGEET